MTYKKPVKILVIDDEKVIRKSFRYFLEDYDHEVIEAKDGGEGLRLFEKEKVDLILVDLRMPVIDGLEVLEIVSKKSPDMPIIVVSGTGVIADAVEALRIGAWDYLFKPIEDMSVLLHAVEKALERARLINENRMYQEHLESEVAKRTEELEKANKELQQINIRLRQLVNSTRDLSVCTEVDSFGVRLLEEFGRHMTAEGGSLYFVEDDGLHLVHVLDPGHAPDFIPFPLKKGSVFQKILEEREPKLICHINSLKEICPSGWNGYKSASALIFPLFDDSGKIIGILSLHSKKLASFTKQDKEIGLILASYSCEALRAAKTTEALKESEEKFAKIFQYSPDAIIITRISDGSFIDGNDAFFKITGFTPGDMINKNIAHQSILENFGPGEPLIGRIGDKDECINLHTNFRGKDGTTMPVLFSCRKVEISKEKCLLTIIRDMTAHHQLEKQLIHAQKMEAIGRFTGGIAHDFNNMLSPILGYTEILLMGMPPGTKEHDYLIQIQKASQRARDLTRQLLAFSRRQVLEVKPIDLSKVLHDLKKILRRMVRENIGLEFFLESSLGTVKADISQIEQVIMNLVINAQDAMEDGGSLTIETANIVLDKAYAKMHPGVKPGSYVMLSFSDTGHGMDNETLKRVFEPFFTTKKKGKGTGLGLATVFGIIKQHGGSIWVYSEIGHGTTFKIYLPRINEKIENEKNDDNFKRKGHGIETILVVEDDEMVRTLACQMLTVNNYTAIEAKDAETSLELVKKHDGPIHLLLTDVIMPKINGKELYDRLKAIIPELKVLYMSGYTDNVIAKHGVLEQGINFIQKPFSLQGLLKKVRSVLDEV